MARVIAAANPDIELLEASDDDGIVRFRNTETGEEFEFSYEDIEEGRFTFTADGETASIDFDGSQEEGSGSVTITSDEGTTTFTASSERGDYPDWVPVYPGAATQGNYTTETPEARAGAYSFEVEEEVDVVLDFYANAFEAAGLEIKSRTTMPTGAMLAAETPDGARNATLSLSGEGGVVKGAVNFVEK